MFKAVFQALLGVFGLLGWGGAPVAGLNDGPHMLSLAAASASPDLSLQLDGRHADGLFPGP